MLHLCAWAFMNGDKKVTGLCGKFASFMIKGTGYCREHAEKVRQNELKRP